jgi:hypothetical protein
MVDHFVEWVNNNGPKGSRERLANVKANLDSQLEAAGDTVSDLVKAQSVTINKEASTIVSVDGSTPPKAKYANTYFIYAIYDKDNDIDYYIVEQEAQVQSGNVYMGYWEEKSKGVLTLNTAYYLFDYYTDHYLMSGSTYLNASKVTILQDKPETTTVSSSLTTGFSQSFSGNLGYNGMAPAGGFSAGISYSNSRTTTIPDVRVANQEGLLAPFATGAANNARWTYQPALVSVTDNANMFQPTNYSISGPSAISVNTAVFFNSWIWMVHNPGSNTKFTMRCAALPRFAYTLYQNNPWAIAHITGEINVHISDTDDYNNAPKTDIVLDKPPRS